jgi:2,4-dienoyl-CoA reductase-like NADH-dependent reductase (Old Yellow Enzyme family)
MFLNGALPESASAVKPKGNVSLVRPSTEYVTPRALEGTEIPGTIAAFKRGAENAQKAGFDGVHIHGANGYLLDQFLTAGTNHRTDRWGGDTAARVQLLADVVEAVKLGVERAVPVGIRISQGKVNDFTAKWQGGEADAEVIFGTLADAGADFIHVTEYEAWQPAFEGTRDSLVTLARRYAPNVTIIANGSLHTAERMDNVLRAGADIITTGRGALANPNLPQLLEAKRDPRSFDGSILHPIANIKPAELELPLEA